MPQKSKQDCQSLVRVLNRMLRAIKSRTEVEQATRHDSTEEVKNNNKLTRLRSRSRDKEEPSTVGGKVKIANIPARCPTHEILLMFKNISMKIMDENIRGDVKEIICELENPLDVGVCLGKSGTKIGDL